MDRTKISHSMCIPLLSYSVPFVFLVFTGDKDSFFSIPDDGHNNVTCDAGAAPYDEKAQMSCVKEAMDRAPMSNSTVGICIIRYSIFKTSMPVVVLVFVDEKTSLFSIPEDDHDSVTCDAGAVPYDVKAEMSRIKEAMDRTTISHSIICIPLLPYSKLSPLWFFGLCRREVFFQSRRMTATVWYATPALCLTI